MNGAEADDIAAAEVRIQAAQAVLDSVILRAPFAGEILYILGTPPVSKGEPLAMVGHVAESDR